MTISIKFALVAATIGVASLSGTGAQAMKVLNCSSINVRLHVFNWNDSLNGIARDNQVVARGKAKDIRRAGSDIIRINTWKAGPIDGHSNWVEVDTGKYALEGDKNYVIRGKRGSLVFHYSPVLPAGC